MSTIYSRYDLSAVYESKSIELTFLSISATALSILRLRWLFLSNYGPTPADLTFDISFVYNPLECSVAIVAACGPALKPLMSQCFPRTYRSTTYSNHDKIYFGPPRLNTIHTFASSTHQRLGDRHDNAFALAERGARKQAQGSGIRGRPPTDSEEEIVTYHGIMRKTEITMEVQDLPQNGSTLGSSSAQPTPRDS